MIAQSSPLFLALAPKLRDAAASEAVLARLDAMAPSLLKAGFSFACEAVGSRDDVVRALRRSKPCLVFCSFYRFDADGGRRVAHEVLEREDVRFVGSPSRTLELVLSKSRLKRLLEGRRIDTPGFFSLRRARTGSIAGLKLLRAAKDFPYIVKPDGENENRGIHARSIAFDTGALLSSAEAALEEYDELIVEHFLGGAEAREYTVAMIGNGERALMMPAEIRLKDDRPIRVVTGEDRERNQTRAIPVAGFSDRCRIGAFAKRVFEASGVRDYARCDLIEDGGRLFALEVNGQPRLPDPWFEACAGGAGLDRERYLPAIALAALNRLSAAGMGGREIPPELRASLPVALFDKLTC